METRSSLPRAVPRLIGGIGLFMACLSNGQAAAPEPDSPAAPAPAPLSAQALLGMNKGLQRTTWVVAEAAAPGATASAAAVEQVSVRWLPKNRQLVVKAPCGQVQGRYRQEGTHLSAEFPARLPLPARCDASIRAALQNLADTLASSDAYRIEGDRLSVLRGQAVGIRFDAAPPPAEKSPPRDPPAR